MYVRTYLDRGCKDRGPSLIHTRNTHRPVVPEATPAPAAPVCATPEKAMADMSLNGSNKDTATKVLEESTPSRRARGAGPSSIIFG